MVACYGCGGEFPESHRCPGRAVVERASYGAKTAEGMTEPFRSTAGDQPLEVRRLTHRDVEDYRALMLEAYATEPDAFTSTMSEREAMPLEWWKKRVSEEADARSVVYGAFVNSQLVGAVGLHFERRERTRHKATLYGTFVRPSCRQRRIARHLVDAVMDHARAKPQIRQVLLRVTASNHQAIRLYEAAGFRPFGTEPDANRVGDRYIAVANMWCPVKPMSPTTGPRLDASDSTN